MIYPVSRVNENTVFYDFSSAAAFAFQKTCRAMDIIIIFFFQTDVVRMRRDAVEV